ncbi:MAG: PD-(D/E)XK nuclease family protein, partial [Bdellovibrionota bacterium]
PFRDKVVRPGELLLALLTDEKVEEELGHACLGLWHRAEELSSRGMDFHAVVKELAESKTELARDREVPPPRNRGQLSVLTLHGSKGLEFPHVILVDLGKKGRGADAPLLFWDREKGAFLGGRDSEGDRDKKNPLETEWRELEKRKNLAESKRLLYVALTRAQERLILVCPELPEGKDAFDPEHAFEDDHWRAWLECSGVEIPRAIIPAAQAMAPAPIHLERVPRPLRKLSPTQRPRHSVTEWNLLSRCERAYEWKTIRAAASGSAAPSFTGEKLSSFVDEEISQKELGTRVHACLERGDFEGLLAIEHEVGAERFQAEPVIRWAKSSEWMAPPRPAEGRDVWAELAFEIPVGREVLVGSIDRLVKHDGRYSLIDFKVTEKSKSPAALLEAYQGQLELYFAALSVVDPEMTRENTSAVLVNISAKGIQLVPVPLREMSLADYAACAASIVSGREGRPQPSSLCGMCEFRRRCPEGQSFIAPRRPL